MPLTPITLPFGTKHATVQDALLVALQNHETNASSPVWANSSADLLRHLLRDLHAIRDGIAARAPADEEASITSQNAMRYDLVFNKNDPVSLINTIREVRRIGGYSMPVAKNISQSPGSLILCGVNISQAEDGARKMRSVGADVTIRPVPCDP